MDKIDIKILKTLFLNSRESLTSIGKKVNISRENVHYRINQLEKRGVIKGYFSEIDAKNLGFTHYVCYIHFNSQNLLNKNLKSLLKTFQNINWVGDLFGYWDLTFDVYIKDFQELLTIENQIKSNFDVKVNFFEVVNSEYYFEHLLDISLLPQSKHLDKTYKLDKIDKKILSTLSENSRTKYTDLLKKIPLSANAIKTRIKKLEGAFIKKYSIFIDHNYFGYQWIGLQIKTKDKNFFLRYLKSNKDILFYYEYKNNKSLDFDVGLLIRDKFQIGKIVNFFKEKTNFSIEIVKIFIVLDETTSYNLPKILFE